MKSFVFLTLAANLSWAGTFTTGQAARLVIGQTTFTQADEGASSTLVGGVGGLAYVNNTLIVADANRVGATPVNNRVLIFNNMSQQLPDPKAELVYNRVCPVCLGEANVVVGQPDFATTDLQTPSSGSFRTPIGVATDGVRLAVADSDNNRVLIWNTIPQSNNTPADLVLGQPDFKSFLVNTGHGGLPSASSMRGPQGVWFQNGKFIVADTNNNRVLIWNSIPNKNGQAADVVVGAPNFTTFQNPDITQKGFTTTQTELLTPTAATSDGVRLIVTDLGNNRVVVWNTIPTVNNAPADLVLGQPDFTQTIADNSSAMCPSNGVDSSNNPTYPDLCESTLDTPRFALSDGTRLFIADGGNDRVLVYNTFPTQNGANADAILGQIGGQVSLISDSADPNGVASSGAIRTPHSLAWDGLNLFVSDPFNRRVMVFTMADRVIPNTGVRNAASREVFAVGSLTFTGTVDTSQTVTVTIGINDANNTTTNTKDYVYNTKKGDTFDEVVLGLVNQINAGQGDPYVLATANLVLEAVVLTARTSGIAGNSVSYTNAVTGSNAAELVVTTAGATLAGGGDAAKIAPGTIVSIFADTSFADSSAGAPAGATTLPTELAGVQVYFNGIRSPIFSVTPTEIRAQIPWEFTDTESVNAFVRTKHADGSVSVTAAVAVPIIPQNPGLFAQENVPDPRPGIVMHGSPNATGTISVDGSINAGDIGTVMIQDRTYNYTVQSSDTLASVRDSLIALINQDPDVEALPAAAFTRIRLRARIPGPDGDNITYSATTNSGSQVILTATTPQLCCANTGPVTDDNPALPGETILVMATGLGLVMPDDARAALYTGQAYDGPDLNDPVTFVSSLAGGKTANVLSCGALVGAIGIYQCALELNSGVPSDSATELTIAQDVYVSNIITLSVVNPNPPTQ